MFGFIDLRNPYHRYKSLLVFSRCQARRVRGINPRGMQARSFNSRLVGMVFYFSRLFNVFVVLVWDLVMALCLYME